MHLHKIEAVRAFSRVNKFDRTVWNGGDAKIGVVSVGKSYLDTMLALDELGIEEQDADRLGLRLYKVTMPWPLEDNGIIEFAKGLDLIIVVAVSQSALEIGVFEFASIHFVIISFKKIKCGLPRLLEPEF